MPEEKAQTKPTNDTLKKVVEKIDNVSNILVAVSKDPTADELSAALGLTMMLDSIGKHATAIYSGKTPDMIEFLSPEKTFESNTNSLQDFIIALNKDKADHLRYKVDGEYVKVFITPYKTTLDEGDLEFSHGDYNVDLVIALGVQTTDDFDKALYEHSRIMHDAGSINITDEEPGKFAELEWNEPGKSSVSEMIADLAYAMKDKVKLNKAMATALLTGIIAKTDRFSNDETTPRTMDVAAKLMEAGADQKQIAEKIEKATKTAEEQEENELEVSKESSDEALDLDKLADEASGKSSEGELDVMNTEDKTSEETPAGEADASVDTAGKAASGPELTSEEQLDQLVAQPANSASALDELRQSANEIYPNPQDDVEGTVKGEAIEEPAAEPMRDYGQMMEEALAEPLPNPAAQMTPAAPTGPELNHIPDMDYVPHTQTTPVTVPEMGNEFLTAGTPAPAAPAVAEPVPAPAATVAPAPEMPVAPVPSAPVALAPEATAVPGEPVMAPVQGMSEPVAQPVVNPVMPEMPAMPEPAPAMPEMPVAPAPVMPEMTAAPVPSAPAPVDAAAQFMAEPTPMQPIQPDLTASQLEQANDPGAFKIPGM